MIVVDSNIIIQCFENNKSLPDELLIVPDDLRDEYEVAKTTHDKDIPSMMPAAALKEYDEAYYLRKYHHYLNAYSEVYFAQMRGFADVSILALVACLVDSFGKPKQQALFDAGVESDNTIVVATEDGPLRKTLQKEFSNEIELITYTDI